MKYILLLLLFASSLEVTLGKKKTASSLALGGGQSLSLKGKVKSADFAIDAILTLEEFKHTASGIVFLKRCCPTSCV